MKRLPIFLLLSLCLAPALAGAALSCDNAEQNEPKALMESFLGAELKGLRPSAFIRFETLSPGYKGSEYVYPISEPKLGVDPLTVVRQWKLGRIEQQGNEALARVEVFTVADLWRPKGSEQSNYGRRVTEIGEAFTEKYRLKKIGQCWFLIDPPKPLIALTTVIERLSSELDRQKAMSQDQLSEDDRRARNQLERELPTMRRLQARYPG